MRTLFWLCFAVLPAVAQTSFYPFSVDQDQLSGAADFSFLNQPISPVDRIFVKDGHFFKVGEDLQPFTDDDRRVNFFGANLAFGANLPAEEDSTRIARRLRRLGINLVRLHHMDSQPDANPANAGSILTTGPYPTFNPIAIQRLRTFLNALKREGIYANVNLHVGYTFRPAVDGAPEFSPFPSQSKPLHMIHPKLGQLQMEFTRKLFESLSLRDDPVLAMVEINNETSLIYHWQTSTLERYLTGDYRDEMHAGWNDFLRRKYTSTATLRESWGPTEPAGPPLLPNRWTVENHTSMPVSLSTGVEEETEVARVHAPTAGSPIIIKQIGFSLDVGNQYVAEVEVRADLPPGSTRNIYWDVKQDRSPWQTVAGQTIAVGADWKKFRMAVVPRFAMEQIGRFALSVENVGAPIQIRNWKLYSAGHRGLGADEELEMGNIPLLSDIEAGSLGLTNDYLLFLADRDRMYLRWMLDAVRDGTDRLVPVAGTQMGYGGLINMDSHSDLDYQDNHFYIDHYNFPNVQWDGRDWRFRDQSAIGSGASAYQTMAATRQSGRPYTVSEYNQPWPNTYAAESDPVLAVFGRFQDWDSVMHFAYSHGRNWDDGVPNGFNINGDWSKFVNIGQAAWLFRTDAVQAGKEPIAIPISLEARLRATRERRNGSVPGFLQSAMGYDGNLAFIHPVSLAKDSDLPAPDFAGKPAAAYQADSGEFIYDPDKKQFLVHTPAAAGVFGFVSQNAATAGAIDVELVSSGRGYAAILLTSLDGRPIAESSRMLLSNPGYTLRSQPGSDPKRPQQIVRYGSTTDWWTIEKEPGFESKPSGNLNGGVGPTWMERVEAWLTVRTTAPGIIVYPLDGSGQRMTELGESDVQKVDGGFRIHLQAEGQAWSPWYEIITER